MTHPAAARSDAPSLAAPGIVLGLGLGGLVDAHVPDESLAWDLGFLAFGALLLAAGWLLARTDERRGATGPAPAR